MEDLIGKTPIEVIKYLVSEQAEYIIMRNDDSSQACEELKKLLDVLYDQIDFDYRHDYYERG